MLYSAGNTVKCDLSQQKKHHILSSVLFGFFFWQVFFWEKKKTHKNECEVGNHKLSNRLFGGGFVILYTFSFPVFFAVFLLFRDFPPIHGALITQTDTHTCTKSPQKFYLSCCIEDALHDLLEVDCGEKCTLFSFYLFCLPLGALPSEMFGWRQ